MVNSFYNPFEYEQANKLSHIDILKYYIEDFNYSRIINSKRNIILAGERGTGKTMTLLFNSFPVQCLKNDQDLSIINVYIPCNTPLTHKKEYLLLDDFTSSIVSEHFFAISILFNIAKTLSNAPNLISKEEQVELKNDFEYVIGFDIPNKKNIFDALTLFFNKELAQTQQILNAQDIDIFCEKSISFSSGVMPFISCFKQCDSFKNSHFSLMIDDAQYLNPHQNMSLNSWISYRDNENISFKVVTTKVDQPPLITVSGGSILEGHDYTYLDMERPYRNRDSEFGKLADSIIRKRLEQIDNPNTPQNFFPENEKFKEDLEVIKKKTRAVALKKYPDGDKKKIQDYVYKYHRSEYFKTRGPKANRPPYSGFETIVHLSSGVIRNLLDPCYKMYDRVYSQLNDDGSKNSETSAKVDVIPANIQNEIIVERSREKWEALQNIDNTIEDCSRKQAEYINNLFDNLAQLFRDRLLNHKSEPRAISFTISELNFPNIEQIDKLLRIARKAQMLYTYMSSAKSSGKRETYYVPNRMLWPEHGLDPVGQHARVSIRASVLYNAAFHNKPIPFDFDDKKYHGKDIQLGLFND